MASRATIAAVLGLLSGCAFGDRQVRLAYPPEATSSQAATPRVAAPATATLIVVKEFTDIRDEKPIGEVRNGFGMHTADVVSTNDVASWVTNGIAQELQAAGYRVSTAAADATRPGAIVVSGQVLSVYCQAMLEYEANVSFLVQLNANGTPVSNTRFRGKGSAGMNWGASGSSYGESLGLALQEAARRFAAGVRKEIARIPKPVPVPAPVTPADPATSPVAPTS